MANTLTISVSRQDLAWLEEKDEFNKPKNPVSPSVLFRSALRLHRRMDSFSEIYSLDDYIETILRLQNRLMFMQTEILKREEKIDSLKNVLEEKIFAERRLRDPTKGDSGSGRESGNIETLRREVGEQLEQLKGASEPES